MPIITTAASTFLNQSASVRNLRNQVDFTRQTCTCAHFQDNKIACRYAVTAAERLKISRYCGPVHNVENHRKAYSGGFCLEVVRSKSFERTDKQVNIALRKKALRDAGRDSDNKVYDSEGDGEHDSEYTYSACSFETPRTFTLHLSANQISALTYKE